MRIMDRYILKEYTLSLIYCVTAFIFLYIVVDLFNYIDEMMRNQITLQTALIYYGTFAPTIFVQIAPMAALLATVYTLSNLKRYNELTAMRVSGVSLWNVLRPLIFMTAILSIVVFIVNDRVVPELMPISTEIRDDKIKDIGEKEKTIIEDIAVFGSDNKIIYARAFDTKTKELKDIIIHQNDRDQNLVMKISAERGYWRDKAWVFENGTTYRLDKAGYIIGTPLSFRRKVMDIKEKPRYFVRKGQLPEFMTYRQLKGYINKFAVKNSTTTRKLLVDLYHKTALPFVSLAVLLVASPFAFMLQRGGLLIGLGMSMLVGLIFFGMQAVCIAMGKAGFLPPFVSAWISNIIFIGAGFYFMRKCS
ncbi:MAG: LptF/LptG family permease [Candidatus Omnitrophota bacterium]